MDDEKGLQEKFFLPLQRESLSLTPSMGAKMTIYVFHSGKKEEALLVNSTFLGVELTEKLLAEHFVNRQRPSHLPNTFESYGLHLAIHLSAGPLRPSL